MVRFEAMSYSGLGIPYEIPVKSSSWYVPDMTLTADVPLDKMIGDALNMAYPAVMEALQRDLPQIVESTGPSVEELARSSAQSVVDSTWPTLMSKLPAAWETVKPNILDDASRLIQREETRVAQFIFGAIAVGALVTGGVWYYRRQK